MNDDWKEVLFPEALYGCSDLDCAAEQSYPAYMLHWYPGLYAAHGDDDEREIFGKPGWYCHSCAEEGNMEDLVGISLEDAMNSVK